MVMTVKLPAKRWGVRAKGEGKGRRRGMRMRTHELKHVRAELALPQRLVRRTRVRPQRLLGRGAGG